MDDTELIDRSGRGLTIRATGHHAASARPFLQAVFQATDELCAAMTGGGGGAAQLLSADQFRPIVAATCAQTRDIGSPGHRVRALMETLYREVAGLRADLLWRGTHAEGIVASWQGHRLSLSAAGRCQACLVRADTRRILRSADTLAHLDVVTRVLGAGDLPGAPQSLDLQPGDRLWLLCHAARTDEDVLRAIAASGPDCERVWQSLRAVASRRPEFDRRAVVALLTVSVGSEGSAR